MIRFVANYEYTRQKRRGDIHYDSPEEESRLVEIGVAEWIEPLDVEANEDLLETLVEAATVAPGSEPVKVVDQAPPALAEIGAAAGRGRRK